MHPGVYASWVVSNCCDEEGLVCRSLAKLPEATCDSAAATPLPSFFRDGKVCTRTEPWVCICRCEYSGWNVRTDLLHCYFASEDKREHLFAALISAEHVLQREWTNSRAIVAASEKGGDRLGQTPNTMIGGLTLSKGIPGS